MNASDRAPAVNRFRNCLLALWRLPHRKIRPDGERKPGGILVGPFVESDNGGEMASKDPKVIARWARRERFLLGCFALSLVLTAGFVMLWVFAPP